MVARAREGVAGLCLVLPRELMLPLLLLLVAVAAATSDQLVVCRFTAEGYAAAVSSRRCSITHWASDAEEQQVMAAVMIRSESLPSLASADALGASPLHSVLVAAVARACGLEIEEPQSSRNRGNYVVSCFSDWNLTQMHLGWQHRRRDARAVPTFSTPSEIYARMEALKREFPGMVRLFHFGKTEQGNVLRALRISVSEGAREPLSAAQVLVTGNLHAREWVATEVAMGFAEFVLRSFHQSAAVASLFIDFLVELWVVPILNVDGVLYSFESGVDEGGMTRRMWRKNRRAFVTTTHRGVDLNRNFPHAFGGASSSPHVVHETYRGPAPLSEPEVQALMRLLDNSVHFTNLITHVSVHTFGNEILYPLGSSSQDVSPSELLMGQLGMLMADAMEVSGGVRYRVLKAANSYAVGGDSVDHIHLTHGHIPAFTIEARPGFGQCCGFFLDPAQLPATVRENAFSFLTLIDATSRLRITHGGGEGVGRGTVPDWGSVRLPEHHGIVTNWSTERCSDERPTCISVAVESASQSAIIELVGIPTATTSSGIAALAPHLLQVQNINLKNTTFSSSDGVRSFFTVTGLQSARAVRGAVEALSAAIANSGSARLVLHRQPPLAAAHDVVWEDALDPNAARSSAASPSVVCAGLLAIASRVGVLAAFLALIV